MLAAKSIDILTQNSVVNTRCRTPTRSYQPYQSGIQYIARIRNTVASFGFFCILSKYISYYYLQNYLLLYVLYYFYKIEESLSFFSHFFPLFLGWESVNLTIIFNKNCQAKLATRNAFLRLVDFIPMRNRCKKHYQNDSVYVPPC